MELAFMVALMVFHILLPFMMFIALFLAFLRYRGLFQKVHLGAREIGLLIIGASVSSMGMLPILITSNYLLALNFGGVIIPVIIAVHLLYKNRVSPLAVAPATMAISVSAYLVTRYDPNIGIIAEFPFYLIPSFVGIIVALAVYKRNTLKGAPLAYASTTLGVLIGADIVRLPMLLSEGTFAGAIGGAGVYDMVFISGMLAMELVLLFTSRELRATPRTYSADELMCQRLDALLARAAYDTIPSNTIRLAYAAVVEKLVYAGRKFGIYRDPLTTASLLRFSYIESYNLHTLYNEARRANVTYYDAQRALAAAQYLIGVSNEKESAIYAPLSHRVAAFLIDLPIIILALVGLVYIGCMAGLYSSIYTFFGSPYWRIVFVMGAWPSQTIYFFVLETTFGRTPGKALLGIKVLNDDLSRVDFMGGFTRNIVRLLDLILLYLPGIVLIALSKKRQRIGDMIARTVVVRTR